MVAFLSRSLLLCATVALAQSPSFREEKLHGRHAYVLSNGLIRVSALRGGGHIAEVRFETGDSRRTLNPMRVPHYPTIEPYEYDPARHDALYGANPHRWLSSGYMGHLLCFPAFGPPSSEEEARNGLGNHGEAPIVEWKLTSHSADAEKVTLDYAADLKRTQFRVGRKLTLRRGEQALLVEEWVENLAPFDRPVNWVQHATFGNPFAEPGKTFMDISATRGEVGRRSVGASLAPGPVTWPDGRSPSGQPVSLRPFQNVPKAGTYYALLMDQSRKESWFTMFHADYPVLIGYLYPTADNPWVGDWQENLSNTSLPWDGKAIARGIEFGTTPYAEGLRKSVDRGSMFGVPTFRWIGGLSRVSTEFTIFLAGIPAGFQGVMDVARDGSSILIRPAAAGSPMTLPHRR